MKTISRRVFLAAACLMAVEAVHAQSTPSYPARPVRMVVPFAPGGGVPPITPGLRPRQQGRRTMQSFPVSGPATTRGDDLGPDIGAH